MKIQSLAIMFIILILPISLVLASYTESRVQTISLQSQYDSKLKDATYDALKAYQINSLTSVTSDYTNSKMRDINASVNTFFNSIATNFSTAGYTKTTIQNYVPALVYTMYDGYYIYSPYTNTWFTDSANSDIKQEITTQIGEQSKYQGDGTQKLYGLKPYVYYSCRYKKSGDYDVVITYSLDNYVTIQGTIGGEPVSKYGYLLSGVKVDGDIVTYRDIEIRDEGILYETVYVDGVEKNLPYVKKNGTKYYKEGNNIFSVLNGKSVIQNFNNTNENITYEDFEKNSSAKKYYKEAYELQTFIQNKLGDLNTKYIVDINGDRFSENENPYQQLGKVFDYDHSNGIEAEDSNFNTHRIDVIKYSIERNLSIAITNFNNYSGVTTEFQMPQLRDTDWDKIIDNISIISFLQGINIGGKVYNGYSIVTNKKNEDVVTEDSIYIQTNDRIYHRIRENNLEAMNPVVGIYNVDLERRTGETQDGQLKYYYPKYGTLSYKSIVTQSDIDDSKTLNEYLSRKGELARIFYTALGRERYSMYRQKLEINL